MIYFIITIAFVVARFIMPFESVVHHDDIFKDMAHLWVGFLLGTGIYKRPYLYLGIAATVAEVIAFFFHKG